MLKQYPVFASLLTVFSYATSSKNFFPIGHRDSFWNVPPSDYQSIEISGRD